MSHKELAEWEQDLIVQCMWVVLCGRYTWPQGVHSRVGVWPTELARIAEAWPNVDYQGPNNDAATAINGCMNEVCNGLRFPDGDWETWFSVTRDEVSCVFARWRVSVGLYPS